LYLSQATNQKFHNLTNEELSQPIKSILGLGLSFIPTPIRSKGHKNFNTQQFSRDALLHSFFSGRDAANDEDYNSNVLRIKSKWTPDNHKSKHNPKYVLHTFST
jgi:hypothetical protein